MSGQGSAEPIDDALRLVLFRALANHVEGYVNCIDRQRRILFLNRTLTRDMADILGKPIDEFIAPPHREATIECVERAFTSGAPQELEYTVLLANGQQHRLLTRVAPFEGPRGEPLALQITTDVSEARRMAEELERSMEFRRRVVEHLPDFVALMDRQHRFVWVNRIEASVTPPDVVGKTLDAFVGAEAAARAHAAIDAAFASGTQQYYELEGPDGRGTNAWYAVRVVPLATETPENVLLITTDITERRRAEQALREKEEQLHRAQRLESLGQLAGGIAHDFNNLLQVIDSNLSFVKEGLENGERPLEDLEQAMRATERAAELTTHLLAVGRRSRVAPQRVELGHLVEQAMRLLRRVIPENVALTYELPATPLFVALDPPRFEQVLINLCVNSRDAMPDGGKLTISIEPDGAERVAMKVSDTGTGIAPENLSRIFEPFFTTKGAGSGLGLAVAAGIVAAHGGDIAAESDGRRGTTMVVRLPRVAAAARAREAQPESPARGSGVILVAEDEEAVRTQLLRTLTSAGYTVLQASDGAQAVALFRQHAASVDLVLLDVVMPELDGWQAYRQIVALEPSVKVLFTTGYAANVLPPDFAAQGARLLGKPYKRQQLLATVRDLVEQSAQR